MKKVKATLIVLFVIIVISIFPNSLEDLKKGFIDSDKKSATQSEEVLSGKADDESKNVLDFSLDDQAFRVAWFKVDNLDEIKLLANYKQGLTADEVMTLHDCQQLVSGGFYSKDSNPIGYFLNEDGVLSDKSINSLFNAILSINAFATPRISKDVPRDELRIAIQSGPLLIENSFEQVLSIKNDKSARRIIAATTGANELYFLAIYNKSSVFMGPKLKNLPTILKFLEQKIGIAFADAINLDGGTASVFITDDIKLSELTPVGSFFFV